MNHLNDHIKAGGLFMSDVLPFLKNEKEMLDFIYANGIGVDSHHSWNFVRFTRISAPYVRYEFTKRMVEILKGTNLVMVMKSPYEGPELRHSSTVSNYDNHRTSTVLSAMSKFSKKHFEITKETTSRYSFHKFEPDTTRHGNVIMECGWILKYYSGNLFDIVRDLQKQLDLGDYNDPSERLVAYGHRGREDVIIVSRANLIRTLKKEEGEPVFRKKPSPDPVIHLSDLLKLECLVDADVNMLYSKRRPQRKPFKERICTR